jgi:hypothetical protein
MSISNTDGLDDLGSFDSGAALDSPLLQQQQQQSLQDPASPASPSRIPYYNPVGLTIGQISPGARSTSSDLSNYNQNQPHSAHSVNAVHMHVQENAKIPLLNQRVDRTNSSSRPSYRASSSLTENIAQASRDFSMAELFLSKESSHRRSLNQNYETFGTLLNEMELLDGKRQPSSREGSTDGDAKATIATTAPDETQLEIDALTAAIDPTPWSEIELKMYNEDDHQVVKPPVRAPVPAPPTSHPPHYSYYPYPRQHQLPIPQKSSPPQPPRPPPAPTTGNATSAAASVNTNNDVTLAHAVATAAALAAAEAGAKPPGRAPLLPPPPPPPPPAASSMPAPPYTKAQQTPAFNNANVRNYQRPRTSYAPPQQHAAHAATHSTSRASVIAATNQKSRYGFGGNHTVPSVPAPPPMANGHGPQHGHRSSNININMNIQNNNSVPKTPVMPPIMPDLYARGHTPPNAGAAYERKKQRAKDARIKLNDAIERLSIGMNLAGSQSKQRSNLLANRITQTEIRAKSLQVCDECNKLADQAKKWDRPSFISTAASMVEGLNSQCDFLMRELVALQERLGDVNGSGSGNGSSGAKPGSASAAVSEEQVTSHPDHKRHDHPVSPDNNGTVSHATKRLRGISMTDQSQSAESEGDIHHVDVSSDETIVFGGVAKMLDPISLSRCPCVSRSWRDMQVFENDDAWLNLAVKRFGFYNIRQWTEKLEDGDSAGKCVPKMDLYREMNAANVMPHIQHEGGFLMGDAKIPGRISGWVFMVERSNGETLRSVKREPGSSAPGNGAYQSRPVVELRIVIQNTGMANYPIVIKNQQISVDISTRRSGGELKEISWDERFSKIVKNLDGTRREVTAKQSTYDVQGELCRLNLFESAILEVHINARGCSTTSKFQQRSNFTKILVCLDGTTVPMVIPFLRDGTHGNH